MVVKMVIKLKITITIKMSSPLMIEMLSIQKQSAAAYVFRFIEKYKQMLERSPMIGGSTYVEFESTSEAALNEQITKQLVEDGFVIKIQKFQTKDLGLFISFPK